MVLFSRSVFTRQAGPLMCERLGLRAGPMAALDRIWICSLGVPSVWVKEQDRAGFGKTGQSTGQRLKLVVPWIASFDVTFWFKF